MNSVPGYVQREMAVRMVVWCLTLSLAVTASVKRVGCALEKDAEQMASTVSLGFFNRQGHLLVGTIGNLSAYWNRHQGGIQTICRQGGTKAGVRIGSRVRLTCNGEPILIKQETDPDPRLVIAEQGPERIVLRVMYSLIDGAGTYHGDGLTDTILWSNGEVRLAFGLRLVDSLAHDELSDAWVEMEVSGPPLSVEVGTRKGIRLDASELAVGRSFSFRGGLPGRFVAVQNEPATVAFGWYGSDANDTDRLTGVGLWYGPGDRSPYYDTWGHLYCQWKGRSGWGAYRSGRLTVESDQDCTRLKWHWLHDARETCGANLGLRAMVGLFFDRTMKSASQRIDAFQNPLVPEAEGAQFRCLDVVENTLLYKKTGDVVKLKFPRDALARTAHLRIFGLEGHGGVILETDGRSVPTHLLTLGGITDDPYGPGLARPGDRFVPIIGNPTKGPWEVVFSVGLSPRRVTTVTLRETAGISLAYVKWDDRQAYVIRTTALADVPLALFSTRTLCLHDVRKSALGKPALVRVPFYWYPTNPQTRGHCLNELRRLRLRASGPEALDLEIVSVNPNGRARSSVRVKIPAPSDMPMVFAHCRLDVLEGWDLDSIQYLNSFPTASWQPEDWPGDWVVVMTADGQMMQRFFKEPGLRKPSADDIRRWKDSIVFIQGARNTGNILVFVQNRKPRGQVHGYMLCPLWLDSHFTIEELKVPVKPGTCFEVDYQVAIFGDQRLTRTEAVEIARGTLKSGKLTFK